MYPVLKLRVLAVIFLFYFGIKKFLCIRHPCFLPTFRPLIIYDFYVGNSI